MNEGVSSPSHLMTSTQTVRVARIMSEGSPAGSSSHHLDALGVNSSTDPVHAVHLLAAARTPGPVAWEAGIAVEAAAAAVANAREAVGLLEEMELMEAEHSYLEEVECMSKAADAVAECSGYINAMDSAFELSRLDQPDDKYSISEAVHGSLKAIEASGLMEFNMDQTDDTTANEAGMDAEAAVAGVVTYLEAAHLNPPGEVAASEREDAQVSGDNAVRAVAAAVYEIVDLPGERKETSDAVAAMSVATDVARTVLFHHNKDLDRSERGALEAQIFEAEAARLNEIAQRVVDQQMERHAAMAEAARLGNLGTRLASLDVEEYTEKAEAAVAVEQATNGDGSSAPWHTWPGVTAVEVDQAVKTAAAAATLAGDRAEEEGVAKGLRAAERLALSLVADRAQQVSRAQQVLNDKTLENDRAATAAAEEVLAHAHAQAAEEVKQALAASTAVVAAHRLSERKFELEGERDARVQRSFGAVAELGVEMPEWDPASYARTALDSSLPEPSPALASALHLARSAREGGSEPEMTSYEIDKVEAIEGGLSAARLKAREAVVAAMEGQAAFAMAQQAKRAALEAEARAEEAAVAIARSQAREATSEVTAFMNTAAATVEVNEAARPVWAALERVQGVMAGMTSAAVRLQSVYRGKSGRLLAEEEKARTQAAELLAKREEVQAAGWDAETAEWDDEVMGGGAARGNPSPGRSRSEGANLSTLTSPVTDVQAGPQTRRALFPGIDEESSFEMAPFRLAASPARKASPRRGAASAPGGSPLRAWLRADRRARRVPLLALVVLLMGVSALFLGLSQHSAGGLDSISRFVAPIGELNQYIPRFDALEKLSTFAVHSFYGPTESSSCDEKPCEATNIVGHAGCWLSNLFAPWRRAACEREQRAAKAKAKPQPQQQKKSPKLPKKPQQQQSPQKKPTQAAQPQQKKPTQPAQPTQKKKPPQKMKPPKDAFSDQPTDFFSFREAPTEFFKTASKVKDSGADKEAASHYKRALTRARVKNANRINVGYAGV